MSRAYWKYNPIHTYIPRFEYSYFYITAFAVLLLVAILWLSLETPDPNLYKRTLKRDGYVLVSGENPAKDALAHLPPGYVFLNYRYTIDGCSLSTFHRDVTSSAYVYETQHPVYTFIMYRSAAPNTPLMSVCPGSHRTTPFLFSSPVVVSASRDSLTCVLFHCDLVHAGALEQYNANRHVEQYKIAHVDDLSKLTHLANIDMKKSCGRPTVSYPYEWASRRASWIFAHVANHHLTPYLQDPPDNAFGKMLVSAYGRDFYNQER
jgi:hypothetical protein